MLTKLVIAPVCFYQERISVLLPPRCRYYPSCSAYCVTAVERFGLWTGLVLTLRRLARCHPFAAGGYDPVPDKIKEVEPA